MPLYQTKCEDCDWQTPVWRRVADRNSLPACEKCNGTLMRIISAPFIAPDIPPYISPATGKIINSRPQMEDDLSRSGHIMREPGIEKDIARNKEYQRERSFAPIA